MPASYNRLSAQLGFVVLGLAAVFNLGALSVAETSYEQLQVASAEVMLTHRVSGAIDRLRIDLLEAENAHRGFLLTGDDAYLAPYREAQPRIGQDLDTLQRLVADNPVQTTQLGTVRRLVTERLDQIAAAVAARRAAAAGDGSPPPPGQITLDTVRASLDTMLQEEARIRAVRVSSLGQHQHAIRLGFFAEASLNLLLVTLGAIFLWGELRRHRREREALQERGATLEAQVRERTAQLTELSRFQEHVREDEKKRVARELHDELGGTLTAAKIDLQLIADRLRADPVVASRVARISAALDDAIAVKRRIIEDLRPTLLDNLGICAALKWQCEEFAKRTGCTCRAICPDADDQPGPEQSVAFYRIVQEALTNTAKYAQAKTVEVVLARDAHYWRLRVHDDGIGIDPAKQHHPTSHGLISIRERVHALGGEIELRGRPGEGTTIDITLPVTMEAETVAST